MGEILLISSDWQMRALLRAQLLEDGYEVKAWPSLEPALAYLLHGGEAPRLTILDLEGIEVDVRALSDLWRLTGQALLVLCGGSLSRSFLAQEGLPPAVAMLRPFRLGDLVEQVRTMLSGRTE